MRRKYPHRRWWTSGLYRRLRFWLASARVNDISRNPRQKSIKVNIPNTKSWFAGITPYVCPRRSGCSHPDTNHTFKNKSYTHHKTSTNIQPNHPNKHSCQSMSGSGNPDLHGLHKIYHIRRSYFIGHRISVWITGNLNCDVHLGFPLTFVNTKLTV